MTETTQAMNEPMRSYMDVGLIHFMAFPETMGGDGPILETLKKIAVDPYFSAVAVSWIKDPEIRKQACRMLQLAQMRVVYGAHPSLLSQSLNPNDLDEKRRQNAVDELKKGIDEAYEIGAESFVFLSREYTPEEIDQSLTKLIDSTRELCNYAKSKGDLKILLEVFDHEVDKKSLIGPADLAKRYSEEVCKDFENFGLVVDLSHIPIIGETHEEAILPVQSYLAAADIGNCLLSDPSSPRHGDHHPWFAFPGGENGVEELTRFLKILLDIEFLNKETPPIVSFEVKPMEDDDPDVVIANAKRTLDRAWARLYRD